MSAPLRLKPRALLCVELLRLGEASVDELSSRVGVSAHLVESICEELRARGVVEAAHGRVRASDRLELALEAMREGASAETVASYLSWQDFERFCSKAFEMNGFSCTTRLRFKGVGRLFEVDVVASRRPLVVAVDCKSWGVRRGKASMLRRAVERHLDRCRALASALGELSSRVNVAGWGEAIVVPSMVTLLEESLYVYMGVPIVPAHRLNSFIQELHDHVDELASMRVRLPRLEGGWGLD